MGGLKVGDEASFSRTIAECDVHAFAGLTGDFAAVHMNEAAMRRSAYGRRIAHGALLVGFMSRASTMVAERVCAARPEGTLVSLGYDRVRFLRPVFIGDTITVGYRIVAVDPAKRRSRAEVRVVNEDGTLVAVAENILQWAGEDATAA